jgi:hypothetical protein
MKCKQTQQQTVNHTSFSSLAINYFNYDGQKTNAAKNVLTLREGK